MKTFLPAMILAVSACLPAPLRAQGPDEAQFQAYASYVASLLGVEFTAEERAELRRQVSRYWAEQDRESMNTVAGSARMWQQMQSQPAELRAVALLMTRPDALLGLQKAAGEGREDSAWLLEVHYRAHPPLAPGKRDGLPLTREMVEAELLLKHFVLTEIHRRPAARPDRATVDRAASAAAAMHGQLNGARQVELARQPGEHARVRYAWPRASAQDRLLARAEMGAALSPQEQAAAQQLLAGLQSQLQGMRAQHRQSMLGGAMQGIRDNMYTIMGRGTVWNPATNRWEQQGGIMTEYNGTVRVP